VCCLLLATGSSQGYQIAKALGHQIEPPVPSLFTFNVLDDRLRIWLGCGVCAVEVVGGWKDPGADWTIANYSLGSEGPAVLKLSAWGAGVARLPLSSNFVD